MFSAALDAARSTGPAPAPRPLRRAGRRTASVRAASEPGRYIEQSLMESRLLEKLLADKKAELTAYDAQLEEYLRLSVTRAAAGAQPLLPRGRAVQASLGAPVATGAEANAATLARLLAAKKAELAAANAEVAAYNERLAAAEAGRAAAVEELAVKRAAALAAAAPPPPPPPPPPPVAETPLPPMPAADASAADRLAQLEARLAEEQRRKEEALAANEALRLSLDASNAALAAQLAGAEDEAIMSATAEPLAPQSRGFNSPAIVGVAALGLAAGVLEGAKGAVESLERMSSGTRVLRAQRSEGQAGSPRAGPPAGPPPPPRA